MRILTYKDLYTFDIVFVKRKIQFFTLWYAQCQTGMVNKTVLGFSGISRGFESLKEHRTRWPAPTGFTLQRKKKSLEKGARIFTDRARSTSVMSGSTSRSD